MNLEDIWYQLFFVQVSSFDLSDVVCALIGPVLCNIVIIEAFRKSFDVFQRHKLLMVPLIFLSCLTAFVMLLLNYSLALGFGLVGALSVIRFRTSIQTSLELCLILIAIAIGLSTGTKFYIITIIASLALSLFIVVLGIYQKRTKVSSPVICEIRSQNRDYLQELKRQLNHRQIKASLLLSSESVLTNEFKAIVKLQSHNIHSFSQLLQGLAKVDLHIKIMES